MYINTTSMGRVLIILVSALLSAQVSADNRVMGWLEPVTLQPTGIVYTAKLDTGAKTASLNALHIKLRKKKGKVWVSFSLKGSHNKKLVHLERLLVREVNIKERADSKWFHSDKRYVTRPVVMMGVCLGGIHKEIEVNLVDRSHFHHPLLIGRTGLKQFSVVIDPSKKHTSKASCQGGDS